VNYRPYPDRGRALHQVERGRVRPYHYVRRMADGTIAETHIFPNTDALKQAMRGIRETTERILQRIAVQSAQQTGRSAITAATVAQAVKAGEHVHVATLRGVRCAGGDRDCQLLPPLTDGAQVTGE